MFPARLLEAQWNASAGKLSDPRTPDLRPGAGIGVFIFILPRTWRLLREAVGVLLEGTPANFNMASVREMIAGTTGVEGVHDLHIWSLTSGMNAISVHVVVGPEADHASVRQACPRAHLRPVRHPSSDEVELRGEEEAEVHL